MRPLLPVCEKKKNFHCVTVVVDDDDILGSWLEGRFVVLVSILIVPWAVMDGYVGIKECNRSVGGYMVLLYNDKLPIEPKNPKPGGKHSQMALKSL